MSFNWWDLVYIHSAWIHLRQTAPQITRSYDINGFMSSSNSCHSMDACNLHECLKSNLNYLIVLQQKKSNNATYLASSPLSVAKVLQSTYNKPLSKSMSAILEQEFMICSRKQKELCNRMQSWREFSIRPRTGITHHFWKSPAFFTSSRSKL